MTGLPGPGPGSYKRTIRGSSPRVGSTSHLGNSGGLFQAHLLVLVMHVSEREAAPGGMVLSKTPTNTCAVSAPALTRSSLGPTRTSRTPPGALRCRLRSCSCFLSHPVAGRRVVWRTSSLAAPVDQVAPSQSHRLSGCVSGRAGCRAERLKPCVWQRRSSARAAWDAVRYGATGTGVLESHVGSPPRRSPVPKA